MSRIGIDSFLREPHFVPILVPIPNRIQVRISIEICIGWRINAAHPRQAFTCELLTSHRQVLCQNWIRALPHARSRVVITRPEVVQPGLLVELLAREEVGVFCWFEFSSTQVSPYAKYS